MIQWLATALFIIVFIQLFLALSLYLWKTIYDFFKSGRVKRHVKPPPEVENGNSVKLHISEGLLEVNRLPDQQEEP